jgi:tetratricopeptide (TPR) repeat protein
MPRARLIRSRVLALALAVTASTAFGQEGRVTSTITPMEVTPETKYEGSQYRESVQALFASTDPVVQRWARLRPLLAYCDGFRSGATLTYVSVANDSERKHFEQAQPPGTTVKAIDVACPLSYIAGAYFSIEEDKADAALAYLDKAGTLAPYMGWVRTERGFVLNSQGKRQEAMAAYRQALELARQFPGSAYAEPIALRGIGWTLVELGDLEGARQAYVDSQKSDPDNANTKAELDYIDGLLKKGGPTPSSGAFGLQGVPKSSDVIVQRVRKMVQALESDPFSADAADQRATLIDWIKESPDVTVLVCNVLDLLGPGKKAPPYGGELLVQSMAGNALWQLENPGQKDSLIGQQAAGTRSALKAYSAIRAQHPEVHFATLDALLGHESPGELEERLAPLVRQQCTSTPAPARP